MIVPCAPFDGKFAARQTDDDVALGAAKPRGGHSSGAGGRSARLRQSGTALPGADHKPLARWDRRQRDIGALRKQRIVLEHGTNRGKIVTIGIIDPKNTMPI